MVGEYILPFKTAVQKEDLTINFKSGKILF